jgi:hypothetical protein
MKNILPRRAFVKTAVAGTIGIGITRDLFAKSVQAPEGKRIGIIGLDTSHAPAFTNALNNPSAGPEFGSYKIVAAYPHGSREIKSSYERIPGYIEDVKKQGVEITGSIEELLEKVDYVLLETNDGRLHLEQALIVMKAGKRMFIDKPIAASLEDTLAIFRASEYYKVPVFSSSSIRYISGTKEILEGSIGKVLGADIYSPATLEKTHPDLFWYGIHGVETLFTIMGIGCTSVSRTNTENFEKVTGVWSDGRIGAFRGIRSGRSGYGGTVFGEKSISVLGSYSGYNPLLIKIIDFFNSGVAPVRAEETIEIFTFMAAAEESKLKKGKIIQMQEVLEKARSKADKIAIN